MSYNAISLNSANPAQDAMSALDPYITGAGFTFIETYINGTNITNVYKSPAASNSAGVDWYFFVNRTSATATLISFSVSEAYNSTTHLATKYAPAGVPTTCNTSDYTVSDAGVLPSSVTSGASLFKTGLALQASSTSTAFQILFNVNPDRVIASPSNPSVSIGSAYTLAYSGLFDPISDNYTLALGTIQCYNSSTNTSQLNTFGAMTRDPGLSATVSATTIGAIYAWHIQPYLISALNSWHPTLTYGAYADAAGPDILYGGSNYRALRGGPWHTRSSSVQIYFLFKDLVVCAAGSGSQFGGDTLSIAIGGTTYNYVRGSSSSAISTFGTPSLWIPTV